MKFPTFVLKRFHRLQWKLTISYLITCVIVLCLLELLVTLIGVGVTLSQDRETLEHHAQLLARIAGPTFPATRVAYQQQLQAAWELLQESNPAFQGYIAAVDTQGRVIVAAGDHAPVPGYDLRSALPASVQQDARGLLSSHASPSSPQSALLRTSFEQGREYIVAPLLEGTTTQGILVVSGHYVRFSWENVLTFLLFFGVSAAIFFLGAGVVGLAFGAVTARGLVRRLQQIAAAVEGWSLGDFSTFVSDPSRDEVGQLAHRLNHMAQQLQQLLRMRQDLATVEERNRLARDLHDSVKQQIFAVSLHVSTTKALMRHDEQAAQAHLLKAEVLVRQTQRELMTLIRELRPVDLEDRSLAQALQEYTHSWQEQTGIPVELKVDGDIATSLEVENAFFRIAQEGLANIARHSQASLVKLHLTCATVVTLAINDNGCGFDVHNREQQGVGLSSIRERVQALGGHLDIQSSKGQGTTIIVWCPQTEKDAS
ncbi:sensor histidine kinase [Ktedonobacter robiniae]|uniref:Oxygen sensor histidine kinase NreB n=1 Tax=Ktedonobacter robiniae TaxID=2778365 RepID=A0ABQ3UR82_9CHLR|nr:sensor histidine kinase [Ktedonobacter robiniae]GHO55253.1 histidine kinase [Ktedonobacter robiniae]